MKKFNHKQTIQYWNNVHRFSKHDLKAVCFPDRSVQFNKFFDRIQKYAIRKSLKYLNLDLNNKNILDVGCGRGRWLEFYRSLGANPIGIDISMDAIDSCRKKGFTAINASIENMQFADNSFDIVNSVAVLQHLSYKNQSKTVNKIQHVIRYGGYVMLLENTWNDTSPHVWGRSVKEWCSLFHNCDLVFCETHYYIYLLRLLWRIPFIYKYSFCKNLLETLFIAISYPLEFSLMKKNFRKINKGGLQHLMIFKKTKGKENK